MVIKKIELKNIEKTFFNNEFSTEVFKSLDLILKNDEIVSIVGPNGCGKSTLLNILAKIDSSFNGTLKSNASYTTSYMFQDDLLIPWRNSYQNAILGAEISGVVSNDIEDKAKNFFKKFSIEDKLNSYPASLSGGERQKVALIRTILPNSDLLLFDEPFASIDFQRKIKIYSWLYLFLRKRNKPVLIVTHDIEEAINLSNKVIILNSRPKGVNKIININIPDNERDPVKLRKNPLFVEYFNQIMSCLENISDPL